jgi:hypothetical protein
MTNDDILKAIYNNCKNEYLAPSDIDRVCFYTHVYIWQIMKKLKAMGLLIEKFSIIKPRQKLYKVCNNMTFENFKKIYEDKN